MAELNKRQQKILEILSRQPQMQTNVLLKEVSADWQKVSRMTLIRDLNALVKAGMAQKTGKGRAVAYAPSQTNRLLSFVDVDAYFQKDADKRLNVKARFDFSVFSEMKGFFKQKELDALVALNERYLEKVKKLTPTLLRRELERLTIELSWKSSQIEGNTYSLLETEALFKHRVAAKGHDEAEAKMLLNHKAALEHIFSRKEKYKKIKLQGIQNIHNFLIHGMGVKRGIRNQAVGIVGTRYKPLDNVHQIREAMEKTVKAINKVGDPFSKAFIALLMISYIQPFEDGNKRTARLLADAILFAHNACPISFRSIDVAEYKKAVLLFYEQNNASYCKQLFMEQFVFAVDNYFG